MKKPSNNPTKTTVPEITDSTVAMLSPTDKKKINMIKNHIEFMNSQIDVLNETFKMMKESKDISLYHDTYALTSKRLDEI
jgi:hypothetical protein